jgi:two-component system chemotaxis response regulator CheB
MLRLRKGGARCLAQDHETSVVYGMPRVALELGGAEAALPITAIAPAILDATSAAAGTVLRGDRTVVAR